MFAYVSSIISTLLLEGEMVVSGQEKYNMATFMVLFLLITIEVVVVKVVTSDMERDEDSHSGRVENAAASSGLATASAKEEAHAMETVRDFVEKIVVGLIGKMDDAPINRLYDHPACKLKYDKLLEELIIPMVDALTRMALVLRLSLSDKPNGDTPAMAHTALREIVERAVDEARKLPGLGGGSTETGRSSDTRNIVDHSYEDLLATAILNKVIEKYQKEQVDGNSNVLHGKPVPASKCAISESEIGFGDGVEDGCSSLEPLSQDDCSSDCSQSGSRQPRNQPEPLSLTIEERIEEVTTTYTSGEDPKDNDALAIRNTHRVPFPELGMDIIDPSQESEDSQDEPDTPTTHIGLVSPLGSWEENWLFQKKRVQTQADPVAMLVPNPSADFKALIGDKDAEDTSDLSECSSAQSDEEIEKELMEAIINVVPRSPEKSVFRNGLDIHPKTSNNGVEDSKQTAVSVHTKIEENENKIIEDQIKKERQDDFKPALENGKVDRNENVENEIEKNVEATVEKKEFVETNSSNCYNLSETTTTFKVEDTASNLPKTPTCTPRQVSVTEGSAEIANHAEMLALKDQNVLSSLESAKMKLMAVDEDTSETIQEEEKCAQQENDFHAEDIQQESEYTEHYDIATQRHLDSLTKTDVPVVENWSLDGKPDDELPENEESRCREAVALAKAGSASRLSLRNEKEQETQLAAPPRPGTIAEREHKKWENAPPIQNNPYSEENIQKRLWERQYSRRPSDIPGIHAELPKSNGTDLEVVLTPQEPDIKRFGRDYYINSRASINEKGRRSTASTSSRPSSSLSQGSSSIGPDQEQQVSFQLEKFEEASLRGSLPRWTYRDPYSSPHFAINPLLRLEHEGSKQDSTDHANQNTIKARIHAEDTNISDEPITCTEQRTEKGKMMQAYNPLYELEQMLPTSLEKFNPDQDSGMYSIDLPDPEDTRKQDGYKRLRSDDCSSDQILSSNGKRYWNFNSYEHHTFGGIKSSTRSTEDSDEERSKYEVDELETMDVDDFGKLRLQTFGGIKRNKKIDGKRVTTCRKMKLRSSWRAQRNAKGAKTTQSESGVRNHTKIRERLDLRSARNTEWSDEDYFGKTNSVKNTLQAPNHYGTESRRKCMTKSSKGPTRMIQYQSSSDENWQDSNVPDRTIMAKFLKDASKKANTAYYFNTSRRKVFNDSKRARSLNKHRFSDDNESLKLEPPIVPDVVERTFETLRDLRTRTRKRKSPEPRRKLGVWSLSDVTICCCNCQTFNCTRNEDPRYKETEYLLNRSNDVKSKVAKWQRNNNLETSYQSPPVRQTECSNETEMMNKGDRTWEDQRMEEILENERKNNKNEINAKLNNQETYDVIETKKSNAEENQKKIKRIDLKAYGFENEFCLNKRTTKTTSPRVVNKLDLKSFGYDGGIRRTQSNIHLNSISRDDFKPRITNKSNLTRHNDYDNGHDMVQTQASGDNNLTQSTEDLNKFEDETYNGFGLKSAKSVPNIARYCSNTDSNQEDEEVESYHQNSYSELGTMKNGSVRSLASTYSLEKSNVKSTESSVDESGNDTDNSSERGQSQSLTTGNSKLLSEESLDRKVLPLPSVRRLAQAFSKQAEPVAAPVSKINKTSNVSKERSSTPEVQIVETPRQMHSLTARSLSKQFREGLRQIPNKVTSPPASHVTMEQTADTQESQPEVIQTTIDNIAGDTKVILPGKLKSNIIFWEQMQRKS
ncbi:hypothetical protein WN55_10503 [Dufourea novaeangliae]|uniref:Uncharacterized protein n=1 Tax=Dufourea novaeangliae TaxID=178035 RepID=A0A154P437_DUFNO|nr:hypothetical protein WN55_10503 [Dufourea novaeangliae]